MRHSLLPLSLGAAFLLGSKDVRAEPFDTAAARIIHIITHKDLPAFTSCCDEKHDLICSMRYWDADRDNAQVTAKLDWNLPSARGVWTEAMSSFSDDGRRTDAFKTLFDQYCALFHSTDLVKADRDAWDIWQCRHLGPSIIAKLASDAYCYIQLRKENRNWRIWKLEVVLH